MRERPHRSLLLSAWLAVCVVGCGASEAPDMAAPPDLSAAASSDLATPLPELTLDLGRTPGPTFDLAWNGCAGTPLAGTCVERFFAPSAACFAPAGHCSEYDHNSGDDLCWQNGASFHGPATSPPPTVTTYQMGKNRCLTLIGYYNQHPSSQFCGVDQPCRTEAIDGGEYRPIDGATFDSASGVFTCPDGTKVDVGPSLSICPQLAALLDPHAYCDRQAPITFSCP
jgi:hypothetical protein